MLCSVCEKVLVNRQKKFCSTKCKNIFHQNYESQQKRGISRRNAFIKKLGNCCSKCGYKKNTAALSFHHTDGDEKDFKLTLRECSNNSLETLLKELDKCILLCANCHMELHYPQYENK